MWTQNKMYSREHNNNTIGYQSGISSRQLAKTWGASGTRSSAWGNLWNGFLITSLYRIPLYNSWLLKYLSVENSWVNPRVGSKGPHHFGFSPQGEIQSGRCDGPAVLAIKKQESAASPESIKCRGATACVLTLLGPGQVLYCVWQNALVHFLQSMWQNLKRKPRQWSWNKEWIICASTLRCRR